MSVYSKRLQAVFLNRLVIGVFSVFALFNGYDAAAVGRFGTGCGFVSSGSGGNGFDGSNCDSGLSCQFNTGTVMNGVCGYPTEVVCGTFSATAGLFVPPCGIGMQCISATDGTIISAGSGKTISTANSHGTCMASGGATVDKNAITDLFCVMYKLMTGNAARVFIVICVGGVGIVVMLSNIEMKKIGSMAFGVGLLLGGGTIVMVVAGRGITC